MKLRTPWILAAGFLTAGAAWAEDTAAVNDGPTETSVEIGDTVSVPVGRGIGLVCDDLTLATVEMHAGDDKNNVLQVTGLKVGATLCRIGEDQLGYKKFVHITVTPKDKTASKAPSKNSDAGK